MIIDLKRTDCNSLFDEMNKNRRQNSLYEYYKNPNYCKHCGKLIDVRENERASVTKRRVFCSSKCYSMYKSLTMQGNHIRNNGKVKSYGYCINCGKELNKGATKYCSNKCQTEYINNDYIARWKNGEISGLIGDYGLSDRIKKYIRNKFNNKCARCGWSEINPVTGNSPLEIHHIDGDYTNNSEDNLTLLCPNCHSLTENYKSLNKNGRTCRNKYYNKLASVVLDSTEVLL